MSRFRSFLSFSLPSPPRRRRNAWFVLSCGGYLELREDQLPVLRVDEERHPRVDGLTGRAPHRHPAMRSGEIEID